MARGYFRCATWSVVSELPTISFVNTLTARRRASRTLPFLGIFLLAIYSAGLAVPFLITSFGIERFLKFYNRFKFHMHAVEVASGGLLIVLGILLVMGKFNVIAGYFSFLNRFAL